MTRYLKGPPDPHRMREKLESYPKACHAGANHGVNHLNCELGLLGCRFGLDEIETCREDWSIPSHQKRHLSTWMRAGTRPLCWFQSQCAQEAHASFSKHFPLLQPCSRVMYSLTSHQHDHHQLNQHAEEQVKMQWMSAHLLAS